MKLYWHKWVHKRGTVYLLMSAPQVHDVSVRETGEIAIVQRLSSRWRGSWAGGGGRTSYFVTGSPASARKCVERDLSRRSIGLFGVDYVQFVPFTHDPSTQEILP